MDNSSVPLYLRPVNRETAYYVGRYNSDQTIYAYETITSMDLQAVSIARRFSSIATLQDSILGRSKAPASDPRKPVDEDQFPDEIKIMTLLAQSIRHTESYIAFMDACTDYLFARLLEAKKFRNILERWGEIVLSDKKHAVRLREKYHSVAARKISRSQIASTQLVFMDDPATDPSVSSKPCRVYGFSYGSLEGKNHYRKIEVSAHPKGPLVQPEKAMKTGHHEKVHDIGLQQANLLVRGNAYALGDLVEDAELWVLMKRKKAIISDRIRKPYREQFHEVLAFEQGDQMERFIREDLLKLPPNFTPPAPL